ncbi:MAG TPA: metal ABC transporter substrate-binding protein [Rubrobacteraceae bacterium]|nr:metal ABC transporter substrate-binding protein [Rubrobacteraceae bacterium]
MSATISVIEDLVAEVGGDRVEVSSIVPAGADVHTFQPSPSDAREISESEVVFQNGLGLEEWMGDLIESAGDENQTVVALAEGLEPLGADEHGEEAHGEEHDDEHVDEEEYDSEAEHRAGDVHEHAEGNPHLWLDVHNAERYVEGIREALAEADPGGAEEYGANAEEYLAELEELDAYIEGQVRSIPEENRKLVTFHDAFPYFAEAYGLELVDVIIQNPEAEPSGREAARLVTKIEEERVPAIFTEPQFNQGLAETIAAEADIEVYALYSDSLVDDPEADSYVNMMRTNIDRVKEGLG